jgi:hypothetical protein
MLFNLNKYRLNEHTKFSESVDPPLAKGINIFIQEPFFV